MNQSKSPAAMKSSSSSTGGFSSFFFYTSTFLGASFGAYFLDSTTLAGVGAAEATDETTGAEPGDPICFAPSAISW
jgi:hypothetical protein